MAINSVSSFTPITGATGSSAAGAAGKVSGDGFGSMMKDMVESIDQSQKSAETEIAKAVTGESPDIHRTIIALQSADLKFQLGLQVRNKLIGAYDEIMRMQV
jgi:flagellar hook-basal body complex protein FliE